MGEARVHEARRERRRRAEGVAPGRTAGRIGRRGRAGLRGSAPLMPAARRSPRRLDAIARTLLGRARCRRARPRSCRRPGRPPARPARGIEQPAPVSGGTPSGSVVVPRLMSPTKARRTDARRRGRRRRAVERGRRCAGAASGVRDQAGASARRRRSAPAGGELRRRPAPRRARRITRGRRGRPRPGRRRGRTRGAAAAPRSRSTTASSSFTGSDTVEPVSATRTGCMASPSLSPCARRRSSGRRGSAPRAHSRGRHRSSASAARSQVGGEGRSQLPDQRLTLGIERGPRGIEPHRDAARPRARMVRERLFTASMSGAEIAAVRSPRPCAPARAGRRARAPRPAAPRGTGRSSTRAWWCRTRRPSSGCPRGRRARSAPSSGQDLAVAPGRPAEQREEVPHGGGEDALFW